MAEKAERKLRRVIFECFLCYPGHLERIISKNLGCRVRFKGLLGCGGRNVVVDALLVDKQKRERRVALRLLQPSPCSGITVTPADATSGYAATLFLSSLNLPTLVTGPVYVADPPLPYLTRGKSLFTLMPVAAEGAVRLFDRWRSATLEWKKTVLADLATVTLQLYRHPFSTMGGMALSSDGRPCVGAMGRRSSVYAAMQRGIDVGQLSPGPYSSWKEYARNQIQGFKLLDSSQAMERNLVLLLKWLDKFEESSNKFYLSHPEFGSPQVLVDPRSGHVESILDWDGATVGTVQSLVASLYLPLHEYYADQDEDEDELFEFYGQQLIQGGAPELVEHHVMKRWYEEPCDPQLMFEVELNTLVDDKDLEGNVYGLCKRMQQLGIIDPADEIVYTKYPWSSSSSSSSQESLQGLATDSSFSSSSSSQESLQGFATEQVSGDSSFEEEGRLINYTKNSVAGDSSSEDEEKAYKLY